MGIHKQFALKVLETLKETLAGECSLRGSSCPEIISMKYHLHSHDGWWKCSDCVEMFESIVDLEELCIPNKTSPCPCKYVPEIALARLDEYIEELKQI